MDNKQIVLLVMAASLLVFLLVGVFGASLLAKFPPVRDAVIRNLEKDYSPSPYGPGFDPDKINVNAFNRREPPGQQPSDDWR